VRRFTITKALESVRAAQRVQVFIRLTLPTSTNVKEEHAITLSSTCTIDLNLFIRQISKCIINNCLSFEAKIIGGGS